MACVPPRAGSDAAGQYSVAQGVQLSKHYKMKQSLFKSSLWHKTCKSQPHVWHVRNMASEAVVIEEMEASDFNEKKTMHWQRWQAHETMVLIAAKKQQDLGQAESTEAARFGSKKAKNKWKEIESFCRENGIERSAEQCQTRWSRLTSAYTQITSWEENKTPEQLSFWSMKLDERKSRGFALILDQKTYNALDELNNSKGDDIKYALNGRNRSKGDDTENAMAEEDGFICLPGNQELLNGTYVYSRHLLLPKLITCNLEKFDQTLTGKESRGGFFKRDRGPLALLAV